MTRSEGYLHGYFFNNVRIFSDISITSDGQIFLVMVMYKSNMYQSFQDKAIRLRKDNNLPAFTVLCHLITHVIVINMLTNV